MNYKCTLFISRRKWSSLTKEDMKEKYYSVLGGHRVWNLYVAHVSPMGWIILTRLGNPNVSLVILSRWECSNLIMWVRYYMSFWAFLQIIFLIPYAYGKEKKMLHCIMHYCELVWLVWLMMWMPWIPWVVLVLCENGSILSYDILWCETIVITWNGWYVTL